MVASDGLLHPEAPQAAPIASDDQADAAWETTQASDRIIINGELPACKQSGRRRSIQLKHYDFEEDFDADGNLVVDEFIPPVYPKDYATKEFLQMQLSNNILFQELTLSADLMKVFVEAMAMQKVSANEVLMEQGDDGDYLYILQNGELRVDIDGKTVGMLQFGIIGELALLNDAPRTATVTATVLSTLWKIDQETFRRIMISVTTNIDRSTDKTLREVSIFGGMDDEFFQKLCLSMEVKTFARNTIIFKKGEVGDTFYVIRNGRIKVSDIKESNLGTAYDDLELSDGDFFGERALLTGDVRAATISTLSDCILLCLSRDEFETLLGPMQEQLYKVEERRMLSNIPMTNSNSLSQKDIDLLLSNIQKVTYKAGDSNACPGRGIYFVREGKVSLSKSSGQKQIYTKGDVFGKDTRREGNHTLEFLEDTTCGYLPSHVMQRKLQSSMRVFNLSSRSISTRPEKGDIKSFEDLKIGNKLGEGSFGEVFLVRKRTDEMREHYALKLFGKKMVIQKRAVKIVLSEKKIMESIEPHPFILPLVGAFQNQRCLCMVFNLIKGGDLFHLLNKSPNMRVPLSDMRFYAACVLEGLSHLHSKNIVHRDVKAENVMIDQDGYCILIDFGFAKVIPFKSLTLCGTPDYLAPEIIQHQGHNKGVDYWALGVLMYECWMGKTPFDGADQKGLLTNICKINYSFPHPKCKEMSAGDCISQLLVRQNQRLGCRAGAVADIRNHGFFGSINWSDLVQKRITPPRSPKIKGSDAVDPSAFDTGVKFNEKKYQQIPPKYDVMFSEFSEYGRSLSLYNNYSDEEEDVGVHDCMCTIA